LRVRRSEFVLAIVAILGVALVGVLEGIIIAVALSILQFFERAWRPHYAILGKVDDVPGYRNVRQYPQAQQIPGLLIIRWNAPFFFANANLFQNRVRKLIAQAPTKPFWVLVTAEPITDVDATAADMLADLDLELNAAGIHLAFAELGDPVREQIVRYSLLDIIDERHFYPTIELTVAAFYKEQARQT
jgi:MFS superfamily sulfate permease-like transporter